MRNKIIVSFILTFVLTSTAFAQSNKALTATVTTSTNQGAAGNVKDNNRQTAWTGTQAFSTNRSSPGWGFFLSNEFVRYSWTTPQTITGYTLAMPVTPGGTGIKSQQMSIFGQLANGQWIKIFPGPESASKLITFQDCGNPNNPNACSWSPTIPAATYKTIDFYIYRRLDGSNQPQVGAQFSEIGIK